MELCPLAPLLCSAAILRRQRFPVPSWGLIHSHHFTMWYPKLNYHVIISRVEPLDCSIQQLDKTMQIEILALHLLRSHRQKSELKRMWKHKATSCLLRHSTSAISQLQTMEAMDYQACSSVRAPGMGTVPLQMHQFKATWTTQRKSRGVLSRKS